MMRQRCLPLLLLCCLLLTSCSRDPVAPMAASGQTDVFPRPSSSALPTESQATTLWFRFLDEPFLAAEHRNMPSTSASSYALSLLQELLQGPSAASTELNGLFPQGTKVLSVHQAGRLMFVTLSRHIMNRYPDEPEDWRSHPAWALEVPLRRKLAMQSIAATATENCNVDTVVILVEQTGEATDSLRLRQSYYTLDGSMSLAEPLMREESLLLTPARTADIILQCWLESDWARLYRYIARTDPATGLPRPDMADFVQQMTAEAHLLRADAQGGNISADGNSAIFTVQGAWLENGLEQPFSGMTLRLVRERDVWRVGLSQLTGREAQP